MEAGKQVSVTVAMSNRCGPAGHSACSIIQRIDSLH